MGEEEKSESEQTWPVKPRKEPLIKFPMIILDTPSLDTNLCKIFLDFFNQLILTIPTNPISSTGSSYLPWACLKKKKIKRNCQISFKSDMV